MDYNEVDFDLETPSTSATRPINYRTTGSGNDSRLVEIFEKEIDREIAERMGAVAEISDNIRKCRQTLDNLRKAAVIQYYMGSHKVFESVEQPSIHPAVKKLIGKRPRNVSQTEQFMTSNLTQWKRETRKKILKHSVKHKNPRKQEKEELMSNDSLIKPRYIPPNIPGNPQENSSLRGNTKKMHMRVLVGNVAKQIQADGDVFDPATHKWMVYVRSAPGSLDVDREVARVLFFLHPSYKPHDIVTVPKPPFTLNRRGWGEFPMRVQLQFKNHLNKPADIIHHLKLNGARSGHHTRSAETFADLWLYPHQRGQENKFEKITCSDDILWLASDMLKEDVPDFTSEVICSRCQTTSMGTDSHNCTCNIKDSTQDTAPNSSTDESSGSSSEESDSEDSTVESVLPKPLPCWENISEIDTKELLQVFLKEEIKEEQLSDEESSKNCNTTQKALPEKESEKENHVMNTVVEKVESGCINPSVDLTGLSLTCDVNQFVKTESDILNVEESDIMDALEIKQDVDIVDLDALEIKQEIEELQENNNDIKEDVEKINTEENNLTSDTSMSTLPMDIENLCKGNEQPMVVDFDQVDDKHTVKSVINSSKVLAESEITTAPGSSDDLHPLTSNQSNNSILDMIIEEVPIDEFINNIVEEEIIVDDPERSTEEVTLRENPETAIAVSETQMNSSLGTQYSQLANKHPFKIIKTVPHSNVTTKNKQTNAIISTNQLTPQIKTVFVSSGNTKGLLVKNKLPNLNQPLKMTPKYVKVQPPHLANNIQTNKKDSPANNSKYFFANGSIQLSLPSKEGPVKSLKYLQLNKGFLVNKQTLPNANHVVKKQKIEGSNEAHGIHLFRTKDINILTSQESSVLTLAKNNPVQTLLKSENTNNSPKVFNLLTTTAVDQNSSSRQNTQSRPISLLKPQFQINTKSKLNIRNSNPNSLLRPSLVKPISTTCTTTTTQSNSLNSKLVPKPAKQILPGKRLLTYSVLKSTVANANAQPGMAKQNSTVSSVEGSASKPINKSQNCAEPIVKVQPQIHKIMISPKITPSCSQATSTGKVVAESFLGQEISRLSSKVLKNDPDSPVIRETSSPETVNNVNSKCTAPESFSRQTYLIATNPPVSTVEGKNGFVNSQSSTRNFENQNNPKDVEVKETVSFHELIRIMHIPKTSVPSRPVFLNAGVSEIKEVKFLDYDCVLSCNSLHNDLQQKYAVHPESQFGRKNVMISKDQINSTVNDQVLYYLEQLRLLVNTCVFETTEAAVRWLVRGLPLVSPDARLMAYKTIHPYCAISREAYCSWPSIKQAAAEWLRAKTVVRLLAALQAKGAVSEAVWTTKTVYWWCRTHGYSPAFCLIGPENAANNADWIQEVDYKTSPTKVLEWMASVRHKVKSVPEEDVDVLGEKSNGGERSKRDGEVVNSNGGGGSLICGQPWVQNMHSYIVSQVAGLGQEPLTDGGPPQSMASTLLAHAAVVMVEDMLRRGLAKAARRGGGSLEPQDVCRAILQRPEFDVFTGRGLDVDTTFAEYLRSLPGPKQS